MATLSINKRRAIARRSVACVTLVVPLIVYSGDDNVDLDVSLDELNQRVLVTKIKPVAIDGKRVVAEKSRVEEVANRICEQVGGRLKSAEVDLEHPVRPDEMVSYHDGIFLHHHRLAQAERFTAFESILCVGLVLEPDSPTTAPGGGS